MWYFTWILGVLLACAFGIINVLWLESQESMDQHTAILDPLTKLPSRVEFLHSLQQTIERQKSKTSAFSLLMISMDAFQSVSEQSDSEELDRMILTVCRLIEHETRRQIDTVARYDAKTFAVILSGAHLPIAEATAKRICRACVEQLKQPINQPVISIGATEYHSIDIEPHQAMETLLVTADNALKKAQGYGGNQHYCA